MGVISNIATASRCLLCFYKARPAFPTGPTDLGGGGGGDNSLQFN